MRPAKDKHVTWPQSPPHPRQLGEPGGQKLLSRLPLCTRRSRGLQTPVLSFSDQLTPPPQRQTTGAHSSFSARLSLLESETKEPSRTRGHGGPALHTLGRELSLSRQAMAHRANLVPDPPLAAQSLPSLGPSCPPTQHASSFPGTRPHCSRSQISSGAPGWGPGLTLDRSSEPPGWPAASRGEGRSRGSGSSSRRGRLLSMKSISDLPSSGRYEWDSGRR